jgi:hypothetical protein
LLAGSIHDPIGPQKPLLDYLFSKASHISDRVVPITNLDYGCTLSGIEYLMDNELLVEGVFRTVSGVVKPEVLFYLRDHIFPLTDTIIITLVCMHDSSHLYNQMMDLPDITSGLVTDEDLVTLCVRYGSYRIAKMLYLAQRCTLSHFITEIKKTLASLEVNMAHTYEIFQSGSCYGLCILLSLMRITSIPYPPTIKTDLSTIRVPPDYQCELIMNRIMRLVC